MNAILTRDLLMNMLLGLVAIVIITVSSINPQADDTIKQTPPGNIVVTAAWPEGNIDVDLWLSSPDGEAVGYSNKSGKTWSLLRDDLGNQNDDTPLNFENAYSRGAPDGEYAVNVRCFACTADVPVSVEVRMGTGALIWKGVVVLNGNKDEKTAARWRMSSGAEMPGSFNQVFKEVRG